MSAFLLRMLRTRAAAIIAVCILVLMASHVALLLVARHRLAQVRHEMAAVGMLRSQSSVPTRLDDRENAAPLYVKAFMLLTIDSGHPYDGRSSGALSEPYAGLATRFDKSIDSASASARAQALAALESPDFLRIADCLGRAADLPRCAFALDWGRGVSLLLPMPTIMHHAAQLMIIRADLLRDAGRLDESWRDVDTALAMGAHLEQMRVFISCLVGINVRFRACESLQRLIATAPALPEPLEATMRQLRAADPWTGMVDAIDAECTYFGDALFANPSEIFEGGYLSGSWWYCSWPLAPLRTIDQSWYDSGMLAAREHLHAHQDSCAVPQPPRWCMISRLMRPAFDMLGHSAHSLCRVEHLALAATALEDCRARHGAYPQRLADLPDAGSEDDDCALSYDRTGGDRWRLDSPNDGILHGQRRYFAAGKEAGINQWRSPPRP